MAAPEAPDPPRLEGGGEARLLWTRSFASPGDDWINDIVPISGGGFLAVGFLDRNDSAADAANDWRALAVSLGGDGAVAWSREYGAGSGIDAFWSAREAADHSLAFAGFTTRIGAGGIDGYALFTGENGEVRRELAFGGGGYDRFTDLAPADDGFVFLGHSQRPDEMRRRVFAVRTDGEGTQLWERIIEGPDSLAALYVEATGDGFIVAGGIGRGEDSDLLLLKLDREGRELWRLTIGTPTADDVNHGLALLPNGNIVLVGYSRSWGARENDIVAVTVSPSGEILRREMLGGAGDDRPILAKADALGRVWIVGTTHSAGAGGSDLIVARLDAEGRFEPAVLTLGGPGDDHGTAIHPLPDGSVLVAGYRATAGSGEDAFVARISAASWEAPHPAFDRRAAR